ncbi:MAG: hypothetical protein QW594_00900 [Candidatus Woesearchaeota archaeon]
MVTRITSSRKKKHLFFTQSPKKLLSFSSLSFFLLFLVFIFSHAQFSVSDEQLLPGILVCLTTPYSCGVADGVCPSNYGASCGFFCDIDCGTYLRWFGQSNKGTIIENPDDKACCNNPFSCVLNGQCTAPSSGFCSGQNTQWSYQCGTTGIWSITDCGPDICTDTDGNNVLTVGYVTDENTCQNGLCLEDTVYYDVCENELVLKEYTCSGSLMSFITQNCNVYCQQYQNLAGNCRSGACVCGNPCTLETVTVTPSCGNDGLCGAGDTVTVQAIFNGLCTNQQVYSLLVRADNSELSGDPTCTIDWQGMINGIWIDSTNNLLLNNQVTFTWTFPQQQPSYLPSSCYNTQLRAVRAEAYTSPLSLSTFGIENEHGNIQNLFVLYPPYVAGSFSMAECDSSYNPCPTLNSISNQCDKDGNYVTIFSSYQCALVDPNSGRCVAQQPIISTENCLAKPSLKNDSANPFAKGVLVDYGACSNDAGCSTQDYGDYCLDIGNDGQSTTVVEYSAVGSSYVSTQINCNDLCLEQQGRLGKCSSDTSLPLVNGKYLGACICYGNPVCVLDSIHVVPQCENSDSCEPQEHVEVTAQVRGAKCVAPDPEKVTHIQVDMREEDDGLCTLSFMNGAMSGVWVNATNKNIFSVTSLGNNRYSLSGLWQIPAIAPVCYGKQMTSFKLDNTYYAAAIRKGGDPNDLGSSIISLASSLNASPFRFVSCSHDAQCNDNDPCTIDTCNAAGVCQFIDDPYCTYNCIDSDSSASSPYEIAGLVSIFNSGVLVSSHADVCSSSDLLTEYVCSSSSGAGSISVSCSAYCQENNMVGSCSNGACVCREACNLVSVSVDESCGADGYCGVGDTIHVEVIFSGDCTSQEVYGLLVTADNSLQMKGVASCKIGWQEMIDGIWEFSDTNLLKENKLSFDWTLPSLPSSCYNANLTATTASLYNTPYDPGIISPWLSALPPMVRGNFRITECDSAYNPCSLSSSLTVVCSDGNIVRTTYNQSCSMFTDGNSGRCVAHQPVQNIENCFTKPSLKNDSSNPFAKGVLVDYGVCVDNTGCQQVLYGDHCVAEGPTHLIIEYSSFGASYVTEQINCNEKCIAEYGKQGMCVPDLSLPYVNGKPLAACVCSGPPVCLLEELTLNPQCQNPAFCRDNDAISVQATVFGGQCVSPSPDKVTHVYINMRQSSLPSAHEKACTLSFMNGSMSGVWVNATNQNVFSVTPLGNNRYSISGLWQIPAIAPACYGKEVEAFKHNATHYVAGIRKGGDPNDPGNSLISLASTLGASPFRFASCTNHSQCNDNDPCTTDVCSATFGTCQNILNQACYCLGNLEDPNCACLDGIDNDNDGCIDAVDADCFLGSISENNRTSGCIVTSIIKELSAQQYSNYYPRKPLTIAPISSQYSGYLDCLLELADGAKLSICHSLRAQKQNIVLGKDNTLMAKDRGSEGSPVAVNPIPSPVLTSGSQQPEYTIPEGFGLPAALPGCSGELMTPQCRLMASRYRSTANAVNYNAVCKDYYHDVCASCIQHSLKNSQNRIFTDQLATHCLLQCALPKIIASEQAATSFLASMRNAFFYTNGSIKVSKETLKDALAELRPQNPNNPAPVSLTNPDRFIFDPSSKRTELGVLAVLAKEKKLHYRVRVTQQDLSSIREVGVSVSLDSLNLVKTQLEQLLPEPYCVTYLATITSSYNNQLVYSNLRIYPEGYLTSLQQLHATGANTYKIMPPSSQPFVICNQATIIPRKKADGTLYPIPYPYNASNYCAYNHHCYPKGYAFIVDGVPITCQ